MTQQTKQDLIDILKAIQPYGFRESCLTDEEVLHLLIDLAVESGIRLTTTSLTKSVLNTRNQRRWQYEPKTRIDDHHTGA